MFSDTVVAKTANDIEKQTSPNTPFNIYITEKNAGTESAKALSVYYGQEIHKNELIYVLSEKNEYTNEISDMENQKEFSINAIKYSENKFVDELEIIRSEIAELFNISTPNVKKIYSENGIPGVIVELNLNKGDQLIRMSNYFSEINKNVQMGMFKNNYPEYKIPPNSSGNPITDLKTIKILVNKGINAIPKDSTKSESAINKYIQMILLDLILGQKSRDGVKYYVSKAVKPTGIVVDLIPGICNYDVLENELTEEEYNLNGNIVDRYSLLSVLLTEYMSYIKNILNPLIAVSNRYKDCISKIIYNNTNKENAATIEGIIFENIDKICTSMKQIPEEENKVELAYTTTQLNLTIANKEDLINTKYPINPRDIKPEDEFSEMNNEDERIKITTDEPMELKLKPNGFVSAALIGSFVTLICGLGIAIASMIMKM